MKKFYFLSIILFFTLNLLAQNEFITVWKTSIGFYFGDIVIQAKGNNYNVYWEEIDNPSNNGSLIATNSCIIHPPTYGTYRIKISNGEGSFDQFLSPYISDHSTLMEVQQWGDIAWKSMKGAFNFCDSLQITATDIPDLTNVTDMSKMFYHCHSITTIPNINQWDVSHVTNASGLFQGATNFNDNISDWDVSHVENTSFMFSSTFAFNGDLSQWDVSAVRDMNNMFYHSIYNNYIGNWDVGNVEDMSGMFSSTYSFDQDLSQWDVSKVVKMASMFYGSGYFNSDIGKWNVSIVSDMSRMFNYAFSFDQNLSEWDVTLVEDMGSMFEDAAVFNQDLGNWKLNENVKLDSMFSNSNLSCVNYSNTLNGWRNYQNCPGNRVLGAHNIKYGQSASEARQYLKSELNWKITDGQIDLDCELNSAVNIPTPLKNLLFPNPAGEEIKIQSEGVCKAHIYNLQGIKLLDIQLSEGINTITIGHLNAGIYFAIIGQNKMIKFVKE